MLSIFPATFSSGAGAPFPELDSGFIRWDDFPSLFEPTTTLLKPGPDDLSVEILTSPDNSSSGSDPTLHHAGQNRDYPNSDVNSPDSVSSPSAKTARTSSGSGSDEPNRNPEKDLDKPVSIMEERKRKRKVSNRESARRSRMRKQRHLDDLRSDVARLKWENRELTNRFRLVNHYCRITARDNDRLLAECFILRRKLSQINQILHVQQLQTYSMNMQ